MELFILDGVDYTKNIIVPSYEVQRKPVTKEWEDATYTKHKDLLRWRLEGPLTIYFDTYNEFREFMDRLNSMRGPDNYIEATFYDNDTATTKTSYYSIEISLVNDLPYYQNKKHSGYKLQIEEK